MLTTRPSDAQYAAQLYPYCSLSASNGATNCYIGSRAECGRNACISNPWYIGRERARRRISRAAAAGAALRPAVRRAAARGGDRSASIAEKMTPVRLAPIAIVRADMAMNTAIALGGAATDQKSW